jgi:hypothetical protein
MVLCLDNPLYLPKGSVRALLALIVVGAGVLGLLLNKLSVEHFLMISSVIMAFYFIEKKD